MAAERGANRRRESESEAVESLATKQKRSSSRRTTKTRRVWTRRPEHERTCLRGRETRMAAACLVASILSVRAPFFSGASCPLALEWWSVAVVFCSFQSSVTGGCKACDSCIWKVVHQQGFQVQENVFDKRWRKRLMSTNASWRKCVRNLA